MTIPDSITNDMNARLPWAYTSPAYPRPADIVKTLVFHDVPADLLDASFRGNANNEETAFYHAIHALRPVPDGCRPATNGVLMAMYRYKAGEHVNKSRSSGFSFSFQHLCLVLVDLVEGTWIHETYHVTT